MKRRITRLSIHQNALMAGILMATAMLPFLIPMILLSNMAPEVANQSHAMPGFSGWALLILPLIYFVFTYISAAIMCFIYNLLSPMIGGFEVEIESLDATTKLNTKA
ncbi:hypothetical protein FE810_14335 [Thalassotalea litorea]|uniref:DUF3566 domain-containing protein n=1 Tax=Thalassotalea litorea TaxID=2020715 RepID=A0A5R9IDL3_9GAMM|nr:DUF3566 domain-containing protein [Thalassotalea litorea]TLU61681.1 hypothetical protein FE810_14335 [Thalassotalea litorea]